MRRVLAARSSKNETDTRPTPRIFKVPLLNFETQDYTELINWSSDKRADPPIFRSFQSTQLEENIHTSDILQLKSFSCHTQAVERVIKLKTEAYAAVCQPQRDGLSRTRKASHS